MKSKEQALELARKTAFYIKRALEIGEAPDVAVILGTGWGEALPFQQSREIGFSDIALSSGFLDGRSISPFPKALLGEIPGHARKAVYGELAGKKVIALSGRVHLNEHPSAPEIPAMVRLQVQMLLEMGVKKFIITNAAGSLDSDQLPVGSVMATNSFLTLFAPAMPLYAGEFCSPEDKLDKEMRRIACEEVFNEIERESGCYAMLRGPFFEGRRCDKQALKTLGAAAVGMSTLPEMCIIALYPDTRALCLSFITNTAFETHSHETNQARAKKSSELLGKYLEDIIERL